jgi:hypothetical protein
LHYRNANGLVGVGRRLAEDAVAGLRAARRLARLNMPYGRTAEKLGLIRGGPPPPDADSPLEAPAS